MKEKTLVETKNKVDALATISGQTAVQLGNLRDLAVGTLELLKNMPGYTEAVEQLKNDILTKKEEKKLELDVE